MSSNQGGGYGGGNGGGSSLGGGNIQDSIQQLSQRLSTGQGRGGAQDNWGKRGYARQAGPAVGQPGPGASQQMNVPQRQAPSSEAAGAGNYVRPSYGGVPPPRDFGGQPAPRQGGAQGQAGGSRWGGGPASGPPGGPGRWDRTQGGGGLGGGGMPYTPQGPQPQDTGGGGGAQAQSSTGLQPSMNAGGSGGQHLAVGQPQQQQQGQMQADLSQSWNARPGQRGQPIQPAAMGGPTTGDAIPGMAQQQQAPLGAPAGVNPDAWKYYLSRPGPRPGTW